MSIKTVSARSGGTRYLFNSVDQLREVAESVPDVERQNTHSDNPETGNQEVVSWRDTLWTQEDQPRMAGNVSANQSWYHVIQYETVLNAVANAIESHEEDISPGGSITISRTAHRMTGTVDLDRTIEPSPGDEIDLDLRINAGHTGNRAITYEIGAVRQVCSNGMKAFVSEATRRQTHREEFQGELPYLTVEQIINGNEIETRLEESRERHLRSRSEARLAIMDVLDVDYLFDEPMDAVEKGLSAELENPANPSLYEVYQAATWAVSHESSMPEHIVSDALHDAARILEQSPDGVSQSELTDPEEFGEEIVERRSVALFESEEEDAERYPGERQDVIGLINA